jgi:hypothetical protein
MSQDNVDVVKGAYDAFARGDIQGLIGLLDESVEWRVPDSLPFGGTYRGHEDMGRFFSQLPEHFEELQVEPEEYVDAGDGLVIARGRHRGRGKATGRELESEFAMFWTVRDGKAVRFHEYQDSAATLSALE